MSQYFSSFFLDFWDFLEGLGRQREKYLRKTKDSRKKVNFMDDEL